MSPSFYLGNVIIFFLIMVAFLISDEAGYKMSLVAPAIVIAGLVGYGAVSFFLRRWSGKKQNAPGAYVDAAAYRRRRAQHKRQFHFKED